MSGASAPGRACNGLPLPVGRIGSVFAGLSMGCRGTACRGKTSGIPDSGAVGLVGRGGGIVGGVVSGCRLVWMVCGFLSLRGSRFPRARAVRRFVFIPFIPIFSFQGV